jgi:hypothetical protein
VEENSAACSRKRPGYDREALLVLLLLGEWCGGRTQPNGEGKRPRGNLDHRSGTDGPIRMSNEALLRGSFAITLLQEVAVRVKLEEIS